jgi:hypothetical protein
MPLGGLTGGLNFAARWPEFVQGLGQTAAQREATAQQANTQRLIAEQQYDPQRASFSGQTFTDWQRQGAQDAIGSMLGILNQYENEPIGPLNLAGQLGSFGDILGEVGGPVTPMPEIGQKGMITAQDIDRMANLEFGKQQQQFGPQGEARYGILGGGMGWTPLLGGMRAGEGADRFTRMREGEVATQLIPRRAEAERENLQLQLAAAAQAQGGDIARRQLTVGHIGNLIKGIIGGYDVANRYRNQGIGGIANALTGLLQPLSMSYQGLMGEQGLANLFNMGVHPDQQSLIAGGYVPPEERELNLPMAQGPRFNPVLAGLGIG